LGRPIIERATHHNEGARFLEAHERKYDLQNPRKETVSNRRRSSGGPSIEFRPSWRHQASTVAAWGKSLEEDHEPFKEK